MRLLFAALVIISHAPQQLDGNFSREPLMRLFHTISLGNLAVAGFFIISGYLVTASYQASATPAEYLLKRILRIYPAFLCAFLLCVLLVAPLVSPGILAHPGISVSRLVAEALTLTPPGGGQEFLHPPWSMLDVPMWTIAFEARCYLLVMLLGLLGLLGLLRRPWVMLVFTSCLVGTRWLMLDFNQPFPADAPFWHGLHPLLIEPNTALYFAGIFCVGVTYRLLGTFRFSRLVLLVCIAAFLAWLAVPTLAELGLAVFFPYLIFALALHAKVPALAQIGRRTDLSYGLYLYAWPISWLIILHHPHIGPWVLSIVTLLLAAVAASLSWHLIEQPALALKQRLVISTPQPS